MKRVLLFSAFVLMISIPSFAADKCTKMSEDVVTFVCNGSAYPDVRYEWIKGQWKPPVRLCKSFDGGLTWQQHALCITGNLGVIFPEK